MIGRIFISYSKDSPSIVALAAFLEEEGYSVWWDTNLTSGEAFREVIERELDAADAVIVVWTAESIKSSWVLAEADHAARANKLITLRAANLEPWRIPKPYTTLHADAVENRGAVLAAVAKISGGASASHQVQAPSTKPHAAYSTPFHKTRWAWLCVIAAGLGGITSFAAYDRGVPRWAQSIIKSRTCQATSSQPLKSDRVIPIARAVAFEPVAIFSQKWGSKGTLTTSETDRAYRMRLTNVPFAGAVDHQELITQVSKSNLSFEARITYDLLKGEPIRRVSRTAGKNVFSQRDTDIFEFTELKNPSPPVRIERDAELKIADPMSAMLIAIDAISRNDMQSIDLNVLVDQSVTCMRLNIFETETVDGQPQTRVRVAHPDNTTVGFSYVFSKLDNGRYYPARFRAENSGGALELAGVPF